MKLFAPRSELEPPAGLTLSAIARRDSFPPGWTLSFPLGTMAPTSSLNPVDATEISAHHPPGETGLVERMWAGGEFHFAQGRGLQVGDEVHTEATVEKVKDFTGRDGRQGLFVTQRREMRAADASEPAIVEKRIYLHRPATEAAAEQVAKPTEARPSDFSWRFQPTDVHLVRFSLLTFNSHRIHWDVNYCRDVEKRKGDSLLGTVERSKLTLIAASAGLVVHGPLTALLLLNTFRHAVPRGSSVASFVYRATAPLIVSADTAVNLKGKWREDGETCELWCEGEDGTIYMSGEGKAIRE